MNAQRTALYRALVDGLPHSIEGLCWTVLRGIGEPVTVEAVAARIGGDPATLTERAFEVPEPDDPACIVHLAQAGSAVMMLEVEGHQGVRPEDTDLCVLLSLADPRPAWPRRRG